MSSLPKSRKQINSTLQLLHKFHPIPPPIAQAIFEENGLDKPTQNIFNNICRYLLFFIDPKFHSSMTWPLYDTKAEKAFRNELSSFTSDYASKGLLTEVRTSYLVHPSGFKATKLMHQLSKLALKQALIQRIKGTEKEKLYNEVTDKYNNGKDDKSFVEYMNSLNYDNTVSNNWSKYLDKRQQCEKITEMLRTKITENEKKLASLNVQGYIDRLVDGFVEKHELDESFKNEILKIKNINRPAPIFDEWLKELDSELDKMEDIWDAKVSPLLEKCRRMHQMSEELIKRETGQIERSSYMLEYDPVKDAIRTDELQSQVNTAQKCVLMNIEQNGKLNFPTLIQATLISMCYILKGTKFGDEVYHIGNRVRANRMGFSEVRATLEELIQRVDRAEKKLQVVVIPTINIQSVSIEDHLKIPPLPDLSGLKMTHNQNQTNFDTLTPFKFSKHQFNLGKRSGSFNMLQPRSLITYGAPKILLSHTTKKSNTFQSNISKFKPNETIAGCSSGFRKEQLERLLSTKKSSKKNKKTMEPHDYVKIKKGALFEESVVSNDRHSLFRSYSSPNLLENRDKRPISSNIRGRKLSIMQEDSPPQSNISGITCLDKNLNTPVGFGNAESSRDMNDFPKLSDEIMNKLEIVQSELEIEDMISPILEKKIHTKMVTASKIPIKENKRETQISKAEKARSLQESHSSKMVTAIKLSNIPIPQLIVHEPHSSETITEFTHFSKVENTRELQESHSSKIVTAKESTIISFSPITDQRSKIFIEKESIISISPHSSKTVTTRDLQENHHTLKKTARMSNSPIKMQETYSNNVTPKPNTALIKKTGSLEKIIDRFRRVRAKVVPVREENENFDEREDFNRNLEENKNFNPNVTPSSSLNTRPISDYNMDFMFPDTEDVVSREPRISLGTMLGVDHTILDQFDLSD